MQQSKRLPEQALPPVAIPTVAPADVDRVLAIGRATAAAAEAICKAASAAHDLDIPDPDGIGVPGLDYPAIGEICVSLLVWAGALMEGANTAASKLTVIQHHTSRP